MSKKHKRVMDQRTPFHMLFLLHKIGLQLTVNFVDNGMSVIDDSAQHGEKLVAIVMEKTMLSLSVSKRKYMVFFQIMILMRVLRIYTKLVMKGTMTKKRYMQKCCWVET